jgi:hypothetical protein
MYSHTAQQYKREREKDKNKKEIESILEVTGG